MCICWLMGYNCFLILFCLFFFFVGWFLFVFFLYFFFFFKWIWFRDQMMADTGNPSRYVKLTKDQAPLDDIKPGELNQPIEVPQVLYMYRSNIWFLSTNRVFEVMRIGELRLECCWYGFWYNKEKMIKMMVLYRVYYLWIWWDESVYIICFLGKIFV